MSDILALQIDEAEDRLAKARLEKNEDARATAERDLYRLLGQLWNTAEMRVDCMPRSNKHVWRGYYFLNLEPVEAALLDDAFLHWDVRQLADRLGCYASYSNGTISLSSGPFCVMLTRKDLEEQEG